ncbi:MAG: hypothetical protein CL912_32295 [Deltaproteobacteria bacterium]|nr:hypothetical protein [Deltaproteobacteria bacterium]
MTSGSVAQLVMNQTFAQVFSDYLTRTPLISSFTGCAGNCSGTVKAAGLQVNCSEESLLWKSPKENPDFSFASATTFFSNFTWKAGSVAHQT